MDPAKSSVSGGKGELLVSKAAARSPTSRAVPTPDRVLRGRELGRIKAEVNAPDPNDSLSIVAGSERFLRDRAARRSVTGKRVDRRSGVKHRNQASLTTGTNCRRKPENLRNKATVSRSKDTNDSNQALGPEDRKSLSNKAAPHSSRSRRSQPLQSQRGPSARVSCSSPALVCKSEPDTETACEVEGDALEGIGRSDEGEDGDVLPDEEDPPFRDDPNDLNYKPVAKRELQKPRQHPPKKELEKAKEDGKDIKTERASDMAVKMENEVGEGSEPPRKRGRRRKDDKTPRLPKRRKKPPVQYVRCEMEGCGTVLAHPRYLQHHIKYQHLLKKKYVCPHPSCGRLFRLQKQLLRHAKHHTDQRDYICEYCARAFKSSHNLAVHRMIHTGEKPLQCEICGFTCRQKASLNWHMKKHDADATYQFSCSICGKKFEKKDSVVAHKAKSHPEVLIAEALAANAGTFITTPAPVLETLPGDVPPAMPHVSQNQGLIPLQQVMLTLSPKNQVDSPQPQLLQLAPHHVVQMGHQPETSTLLQFSATHPYLSTTHPQLIQLTAHPSITTASGPQASLLTLSSIAALSPSTVTSHQAVEWVRESGAGTQGGEEEMMWERVVVERENDVGAMVWEGEGEQEKADGGTVLWEKEGERHMLLGSSEGQVTHGDSHELI